MTKYPKKFRPIIDALARAFPNLPNPHERTPENWALLIDGRHENHLRMDRERVAAVNALVNLRAALREIL